MTRDRSPLRYLAIHARDVARGPLALFVIVSAGLCFILWRVFGARETPDVGDLLDGLVGGTLMVAVLIAAGGVAGNDIKQGYYRAYFSKPIAPWWFYLQRWLLGGVAVLTIPAWLGIGLALAFGEGTGISSALMANAGLGYLLIGGAVFLLSTVSARDWLVVFLVYFFQRRIEEVHRMLEGMGQEIPWAVEVLVRILPPFHLVAPGDAAPAGNALAHVLAYGLGMVALGIVVLRSRPLGSGGRA